MRARIVLLLSLILNLLLVGMIVFLSRETEQLLSEPAYARSNGEGTSNRLRTQVVVRRLPITWADIESVEYPEYIARLRLLGCPEKTIRDIIVADVEEMFSRRITREVVMPDQQWWKADPDMDAFQSAADQIRALDAEKRDLLTHLLGPGWDASPQQRREPVRLDGPVLSNLSEEVKQEIYHIVIDAMSRQGLSEDGTAPDAAALESLRRETRAKLAAILSPLQLEEYLLRYSRTAENLREQLRGFGAGPEEFRSIFRASDPYEQQIAEVTGNSPAADQRRAELERMRDAAVRQAIGEERFTQYQFNTDPLFRAAREQAESNGGTAENVLPIFQINQLAQQEMLRIENDRSLSEEDRMTALRLVQDQRQNSINRVIQGEPAPAPPLPQPTDE